MKTNKQIKRNPSGFVTPKDYFDSFDGRLLQKISENKTKLQHNLPKTPGFEVPEAYFNTVEKSILNQTTHQNKGKVISLWYQKIAKVAAVALILISGYGILEVSSKNANNEDNFSSINDTDLELYIENNILIYSEIQYLMPSENDLDLAETNINELNQETILDYLDDELYDLDLLDE